MEWKATDLGELDTSTVNHEGGFSTLGVPDPIVAALAATGIDEPFRIQIAAIPDAISGKDVLGRASTGSGKTTLTTLPARLYDVTGGRVTIDGTPHEVGRPFLVIATQNPSEQLGTFPLPESQLDRFLMCISLGYPDAAAERELSTLRAKREVQP